MFGMLGVLVQEDLVDHEFLKERTVNDERVGSTECRERAGS